MPPPRSCFLRTLIAGFLLMTCTGVSPAQAILITIEPDDFVGRPIVVAGVTLSVIYGSNTGIPNYAPVTYGGYYELAPTGTYVFGYFSDAQTAAEAWTSGGACSPCDNDRYSALLVQFDRPTNFFEIAVEYQYYNNTRADDWPASVYAFGANRETVAGAAGRGTFAPGGTTLWVVDHPEEGLSMAETISAGSLARDPFIHSVIIGGWENGVMLDRIRFNRVAGVPEPSSLPLLGIGLAGLALWRWRQTA